MGEDRWYLGGVVVKLQQQLLFRSHLCEMILG